MNTSAGVQDFTIRLLEESRPQPWKNGGGITRELLVWSPSTASSPSSDGDWALRVSIADIDRDGPFSAYPGIDRHFAVLAGNGVELAIDGEPARLLPADSPIQFPGHASVECRLISGPTRDLNLMGRAGAGSVSMISATPSSAFGQDQQWRALFTMSQAVLKLPNHQEPFTIKPGSLVWSDLAGPDWRLLDATQAYWLGWIPTHSNLSKSSPEGQSVVLWPTARPTAACRSQ